MNLRSKILFLILNLFFSGMVFGCHYEVHIKNNWNRNWIINLENFNNAEHWRTTSDSRIVPGRSPFVVYFDYYSRWPHAGNPWVKFSLKDQNSGLTYLEVKATGIVSQAGGPNADCAPDSMDTDVKHTHDTPIKPHVSFDKKYTQGAAIFNIDID